MSIMAMLASALGGSAAASGAAAGAGASTAAAGTAAGTAGTAAAGGSFLGGLMDKAGSAIGSATDAMGITGQSVEEQLQSLNQELQILQEEAEFIKTSGGEGNAGSYIDPAAREADLAENAARTQEVIQKIDKLKASQIDQSSGNGVQVSANAGSTPIPSIATGSVSSGQFSPDALVTAAMSGLSGTLGSSPQQKLIQAQHQAFGGFKV